MLVGVFIMLALGLIGLGAGIFLSVRNSRKLSVSPEEYKKDFFIRLGVGVASTIAFTLTFVFLGLHVNAENIFGGDAALAVWTKSPVDGWQWAMIVFGGLLTFLSLDTIINFYFARYKNKHTPKSYQKLLKIFYYLSFATVLIGIVLILDGFVDAITFPLISEMNFGGEPFWLRPGVTATGGFAIAFYGIFIVVGIAIVYITANKKMYDRYGENGILDSTLFAGVIPGLLGARLWYCIAEGVPFEQWANIRDGGLAVQGGVVLGVLCGALWFIFMKKKYSIFVAADTVIPLILLAQACGRWGNFFNQEVFGEVVAETHWIWNLTPQFVKRNMFIDGDLRMPLFYIESMVNIAGYFLLSQLVTRTLKGAGLWADGTVAGAYFVWYGTVRILLEPLRNDQYNMGADGNTSIITSAVYIGIGALFIIGNYVVRFILKRRTQKTLAEYKYHTLICDWDGTLVNSDYMLWNSFKILYNKYKPGEEITLEKAQTFSGPPMVDTLKAEFPDLDQDKLLEEYNKISDIRSEDVLLYPGVKETLRSLKRKGIKLAIFTNKTRDGVIKQLKMLKVEHYFSVVIGKENVEKPKPSGEGLLLAINALKAEKDKVLVVGDTKYDYLSTKDAELPCIIVGWSPRLDAIKGDYKTINEFADIDGALRG